MDDAAAVTQLSVGAGVTGSSPALAALDEVRVYDVVLAAEQVRTIKEVPLAVWAASPRV